MAGFDLNQEPDPVETGEPRPAPEKRGREGTRAGGRQR